LQCADRQETVPTQLGVGAQQHVDRLSDWLGSLHRD
jgi:hypothetical protein